MLLGICFVIKLIVKPGYDMKFPYLTALTSVDGVGLKSAPDMYYSRSLFVLPTRMILFVMRARMVELKVGKGGLNWY